MGLVCDLRNPREAETAGPADEQTGETLVPQGCVERDHMSRIVLLDGTITTVGTN